MTRILTLACGLALLATVACNEEPGRIRADSSKLVGVYHMQLANGSERLELKTDGTYVQDFASKSRPVQHSGQWRVENHVMGGSDVVLANAAVSEDDEKTPLRFGDMILNVHDRSGKIALARNEVADLYFERTP